MIKVDNQLSALHVALVSGFWGNNIGNAFFNIAGKHILEHVFAAENVRFIQDQPGYRTFNDQRKGNPPNDVELLRYLDCDFIVLQGPMLTKTFRSLWGETFNELTKRGTKIVLLSAALFEYTDEEIQEVREFLSEFPPAIISTRDEKTYETVADLAPYTHNGIDSAFFVPDAYIPFDLTCKPFCIFNFDRYPEPRIKLSEHIEQSAGKTSFDAFNKRWHLDFPKIPYWFAKRGQAKAYIGSSLDFRKLPTSIAGFKIIRPEHRCNPHIKWKIYKNPNSVTSDEPFTYFTLYANTSLTLSDRVHACIVTLAYGNPAMLFSPTPRGEIFKRLGLSNIRDEPVSLDMALLNREKRSELSFLKESFAKATEEKYERLESTE